MSISRFDFTKPERDLLNLAVAINVVDAVELACMVANTGADFDALVEELTQTAFVTIHDRNSIHSDWVKALDKFSANQRAAA